MEFDLEAHTFQELFKKIDTIKTMQGILRGQFDKELLYAIGLQHRELPQSEKNWQRLADIVGYGCYMPTAPIAKNAGEQYRKAVFRALTLTCSQPQTTAKATSMPKLEEVSPEVYQELYKEKTQIRDTYNAYRMSLREDARLDSFRSFIEACAQKQSALPIVLKNDGMTDDLTTPGDNIVTPGPEAILMLSDWHIGPEVNNFYNQYNRDIAIDRVSRIVARANLYCQKYKVRKLNVLNLGDLIEGLIHINGRINAQMNVCDQLIFASELLATALNELQKAAPSVTYRSCSDNHSRMNADKEQSIESENLNRITDWWLKTRLKDTNIHMMNDNLDRSLGKFTLTNGKNVVFFHGHQDAKSQTLQNVVGATRQWIDLVCCAHYHNPAEHTFQDMRLFVNGGLCGTGDYALGKRLFARPSQKLIIINGNDISDIDIAAN